MVIDAAGLTHIGLKRAENQDGFLVERLRTANGTTLFCLAVADGMGGHESGRQASELAIQTVKSKLVEVLEGEDLSIGWLQRTNSCAHAEVGSIANEGETVGTTLTVVLVREDRAVVGHVGDSRAYLVRGGEIRQLTHDHTWKEFAKEHHTANPYGNALRQAIGVGSEVETETKQLDLRAGDWVLACSDGLYKMVADDEIIGVLRRAKTAKEGCDQLLKLALESGGKDNVAICLSRVGEAPVEKPDLLLWLLIAIVVALFGLVAFYISRVS